MESKCLKCGSPKFEIKTIEMEKDYVKVLQCSECGSVHGVVSSNSLEVVTKNQNELFESIKKVGTILEKGQKTISNQTEEYSKVLIKLIEGCTQGLALKQEDIFNKLK